MKHTKFSALPIVVGLLILSAFLAACDTDSDAVAAPIGLRTEAIDDLVEVDAKDIGDEAEPATGDVANASSDATVQSSVTTAASNARNSNGNQARVADRSEHAVDPETAAELTTVDIEGLTYMREEEKLARDVYLALYEQWGMPVFQNIAGSEQAHMDSIWMLMDQYGLDDPAAGKELGEFSNPIFKSLYEELVGQGSLALADALKVGATVEELDIVDLEERLAQTDNEYIVQVYSNLLTGSENHLRAFVSNLERQSGKEYQPVYLDQDAYLAIMNSSSGQGNGNGGSGGGNGWGGNGNGGNGGNGAGGNGAGGNGNGRRNGQGKNA